MFGRVNGSSSPVTTNRGAPAMRNEPVIPSRSQSPSSKPFCRPGDGFETQPTSRRPPVSLQVPQAQVQAQGTGRTFSAAEIQRTGGAIATESGSTAASSAQSGINDKQAYLNEMYQRLLGRDVDGTGLETFSGEIDRMSAEGKPLEQIAAAIEQWIKGSSEYQARNGTPSSTPSTGSTPSTPASSSGVTYDGSTPAAGTTNVNAWEPVSAPEQGSPSARNAATYDNVINQFAVDSNPRYQPRDGNTYCNIYAWDVTKAMGAEIPHWVDANGNPSVQGQGRELDANATNAWLNQHGAKNGWRKVSAEEAQAMANQGHPTVASWDNQGGIGHIAVVRPGEVSSNGPAIAQAGSQCFNDGHVYDSFPRNAEVEYWVNDQGQVGTAPAANSSQSTSSTSGTTGVSGLSAEDAALAERVDAELEGTGLEGQGATIVAACRKDNVPVDFVMAQLQKESSFLSPENNLSIANNNPGNLRWADWEAEFGGTPDGEGNFTHFPSVEKGIEAQVHLLGTVYREEVDNRDWYALVSRYAPASDGNDVELYASQMEQWSADWRQKLGI
jgi:hypothetical protein